MSRAREAGARLLWIEGLHLDLLLGWRLHAEVLGPGLAPGLGLHVLEADPGQTEEAGRAEKGGESDVWELERAGVGVAENVSEILVADIGHDDNLALKQRDVINDRP